MAENEETSKIYFHGVADTIRDLRSFPAFYITV